MFDLEGKYLGEVIRSPRRLYQPFFRGNLVLITALAVKRYRLALPD